MIRSNPKMLKVIYTELNYIYVLILISAVKQLITINRIQNKFLFTKYMHVYCSVGEKKINPSMNRDSLSNDSELSL